jgi:hypothetical protein
MAKVRKRTWTNTKGGQTAWIVDYFDPPKGDCIQAAHRERVRVIDETVSNNSLVKIKRAAGEKLFLVLPRGLEN